MTSKSSKRKTKAPIPDAVARLRKTFDSGATKTEKWRREQLGALDELMTKEKDTILDALAEDIRKCGFEAYLSEVHSVRAEIEHAQANLSKWMRPERVSMPLLGGVGAKTQVVHEPLGLALIIGAWNYPIMLTLGPLVGAIAAGNVALIKPSELVPTCAGVVDDAIRKYMDADAFAVVQGGIPETTELLEQRFDHIFFTGSPGVGRVVLRAAAEHLTPVVLELGGKSPAFICSDANMDATARRSAWGKFFNAGQTCIGIDYALVHEDVYDEYLEKMSRTVTDFYGEQPQHSPDFARIVNRANLDRIAGLIDGQHIVIGGEIDVDDLYIAPTILRDVDPTSPIMQEEIFGPVLPTMPYRDLDEAIDFVNAGEKPLAAYIFSDSGSTQKQIIDRTSAGATGINEALSQIMVVNAPFGGVGQSGMGAYHGYDGFLAFTHRRTVLSRTPLLDPPVRYPPYSDLKATLTSWLV